MIAYQTVKKNMELYPDKPAVKDGNKVINWTEYGGLVKNIIWNLNNKVSMDNISKAMIISENRWELLIIYSALATLKIPYTGVDYTSTIAQKNHCFKALKPDLVICSKAFSKDISACEATVINIDKDFDRLSKSADFEEDNINEIISRFNDKKFEAFAFTSGTSGFPKVVYRTKSFVARRMKKLIELYKFCDDDVFLITVPFYHVSISGWLSLFMNLGCTAILSDFNEEKDIYEKMIQENVTTSLMVPPVITKLLNYMENKEKYKGMKFIIVGGKNFPASIKKKAISFLGPIIHEYYGSTETGVNVLADSNDIMMNPYSSGKTMDGSCLVILDENNCPLPYGKVGRIAISSYQNAQSYLEHSLNQITLHDKQYIITADNGYFDEFGNLYVVCRADLMETTVDFNLYKAENLIRLISGVDDVFICTKKGEKGAVIKVYIATHDENIHDKDSDIEELIVAVIDSKTKVEVKYVDKIPYSLSGKVKLKELEG